MPPPLGPEVDPTPRPLPALVKLVGRYVALEPLHRGHVAELWQAAQGADESWAYLGNEPFPSGEAMARFVDEFANSGERMAWGVRPVATGVASGWLTLLDIQPKHASIEIGSIWFSPTLQRTTAATEAIYLLLRYAADELGYRRLVWKCNALNAPSKRSAERLGFSYEGRHRAHMVAKGRRRDTDWYSIIEEEWPRCRAAFEAWLDPANFSADGRALRGLAALRDTCQ
jgi:RimJ/RimL family protein N-acetyltransferase